MSVFCLRTSPSADSAHSNCLEGARYHEWAGWDDPTNDLAIRWGPAVRYHAGYKWLWLNQGQKDSGAAVTTETVFDVRFADEQLD